RCELGVPGRVCRLALAPESLEAHGVDRGGIELDREQRPLLPSSETDLACPVVRLEGTEESELHWCVRRYHPHAACAARRASRATRRCSRKRRSASAWTSWSARS